MVVDNNKNRRTKDGMNEKGMHISRGGSRSEENVVRDLSVNAAGISRATFAGQPNEEGWLNDGLILETGDEAYQCAAAGMNRCTSCGTLNGIHVKICKECGGDSFEPVRCQEIAIPGKATCARHGGTFVPSRKHLAKRLRGTMTVGGNFNEILYCPGKMSYCAECKYKDLYFDNDGISRCILEKSFQDSVTSYLADFYGLDSGADILLLQRLAMNLTRISRVEKLIAHDGELVERIRTLPSGETETWMEPSGAAKIASQLDKALLSWIKELGISKSARDGKNVHVDVCHVLSSIPVDKKDMIDI